MWQLRRKRMWLFSDYQSTTCFIQLRWCNIYSSLRMKKSCHKILGSVGSSSGGRWKRRSPLSSNRSDPCAIYGCIIYRTLYINFSKYQLNAQFIYCSTIYMLYYAPQHVSSSTLLVLRRTNCMTTASGIVTLCKQPYSMRVESGLQSALHLHTVRLLTEGDDTRGCGHTIGPPEDEQRAARNMLRSVV